MTYTYLHTALEMFHLVFILFISTITFVTEVHQPQAIDRLEIPFFIQIFASQVCLPARCDLKCFGASMPTTLPSVPSHRPGRRQTEWQNNKMPISGLYRHYRNPSTHTAARRPELEGLATQWECCFCTPRPASHRVWNYIQFMT